jgi:hypothetical protein
MPAQDTILSKLSIKKVFHDTTKFTQYLFTNPVLQTIINEKLHHKEGNYTLE